VSQFDKQVKGLSIVYSSRIDTVLKQSEKQMLSPASVALFVSGVLSQVHRADDPIMATFEKRPEFLSLTERVIEGAAVGDTVKLVTSQEKPFFGVLVSREGLVFYYQESGCQIDLLKDLRAQLNPRETRIYRRKGLVV